MSRPSAGGNSALSFAIAADDNIPNSDEFVVKVADNNVFLIAPGGVVGYLVTEGILQRLRDFTQDDGEMMDDGDSVEEKKISLSCSNFNDERISSFSDVFADSCVPIGTLKIEGVGGTLYEGLDVLSQKLSESSIAPLSLVLKNCSIPDDRDLVAKFAEAVKENDSLESISLVNVGISQKAAFELRGILEQSGFENFTIDKAALGIAVDAGADPRINIMSDEFSTLFPAVAVEHGAASAAALGARVLSR